MTKLAWLLPLVLLVCSEARGAVIKARAEPPVFRVVSKEAGIDLSTRKVAILFGEVNKVAAAAFQYMMIDTMRYEGDRLVFIDSIGGDTDAGEEMMEMLDAEKTQGTRIVCLVGNYAASMAFDLLTHCDVRLGTENSKYMFHKIAFEQLGPSGERLTPDRLRQLADELEHDDEKHVALNRKALTMSRADYDMFARKEHIWRTPEMLARKYLHGVGILLNK